MTYYEKISLFAKAVSKTHDDLVQAIQKKTKTNQTEIDFILHIIFRVHDNCDDQNFTFQVLEETLKGGYLSFEDEGQLYLDLCSNFSENLKKRRSSHQSCEQQYSFRGDVVKEALFGVIIDKEGKKRTWIQLEKHSTATLIELLKHFWDYIQYLCTSKNIGPFGSSKHTEKSPLYINPKSNK